MSVNSDHIIIGAGSRSVTYSLPAHKDADVSVLLRRRSRLPLRFPHPDARALCLPVAAGAVLQSGLTRPTLELYMNNRRMECVGKGPRGSPINGTSIRGNA